MAQIQKIFTGMDNGPETIQKNLEALNAELGGVKPSFTKQTKEGLVAGNGCQIVDGGYKYMEIGNGKIVWLSILLRLPDVTSLTLDNILTVPQVIASGTRYQFYAGPSDQGMIEGSKIGLGDTKGNTGHKWKSDGYFLSVIYAI